MEPKVFSSYHKVALPDVYKRQLHNHSIVSDGDNDFKYVIETYYSMGYDILAITDHGTVDRGWTEPNYEMCIRDRLLLKVAYPALRLDSGYLPVSAYCDARRIVTSVLQLDVYKRQVPLCFPISTVSRRISRARGFGAVMSTPCSE